MTLGELLTALNSEAGVDLRIVPPDDPLAGAPGDYNVMIRDWTGDVVPIAAVELDDLAPDGIRRIIIAAAEE